MSTEREKLLHLYNGGFLALGLDQGSVKYVKKGALMGEFLAMAGEQAELRIDCEIVSLAELVEGEHADFDLADCVLDSCGDPCAVRFRNASNALWYIEDLEIAGVKPEPKPEAYSFSSTDAGFDGERIARENSEAEAIEVTRNGNTIVLATDAFNQKLVKAGRQQDNENDYGSHASGWELAYELEANTSVRNRFKWFYRCNLDNLLTYINQPRTETKVRVHK